MDIEEGIKKVLKQTSFTDRYAYICNQFDNFDNGKSFKKNELTKLINSYFPDIQYSAKDKSFYKDYNLGTITIRYSVSYKHGYIENFYYIKNSNSDNFIIKRFNGISKIENNNFDKLVKYPFPIATSNEDLEIIFSKIFSIHFDFIENIKK